MPLVLGSRGLGRIPRRLYRLGDSASCVAGAVSGRRYPSRRSSPRRRLNSSRSGDETSEVGEPTRVAPLVVVPPEHLHEPRGCLRQSGVEDARRLVSDDIGRNQRFGRVSQLAGQRTRGGTRRECAVHVVDRRIRLDEHAEVDKGSVYDRHSQRDAVEPTGEFGQYLADRPGSASAGGNDVGCRGTRRAAGPCAVRQARSGRW